MAKPKYQDYVERLASQMVRFNPYAIRKTGLVQNQTLLKVDDYVLICAPFQLSMARAVLLVILSPQEAQFFKRYRSKLASISFTFQHTEREPVNFLCGHNWSGSVRSRGVPTCASLSSRTSRSPIF